ncbi:glutaredoxin family protein [Mycobacterium sp. 155]|uniref:glutaredoxin family protein n=1 Tax=Mycobacterium sp. 155 TaxID=1157943 RepID=UPI00037EC732|nr:glutaredoxin family protein [Mycobacterium sp. 155]
MSLSATVYSKPGCPGCTWSKSLLSQHDIPFIEHDVTTDPAAYDRLSAIYADVRRGQPMAVPVTVLMSEQGLETVFGPVTREHLRRWTRAAVAA